MYWNGVFSQNFWIFGIPAVLGPFFGMKFLFFELDFLQFRGFFCQRPYQNQVFFWNEVILGFLWPSRLKGGGVLPELFGFFWILWNSCSSGPFFLLVRVFGVDSDCSGDSDCSKWVFDPGATRIARSGFLQ